MKKSIAYSLIAGIALLAASVSFTSCEKVSPQGVLMGNTSVDDRVKQSLLYYYINDANLDKFLADSIKEYSFIVGSDSHITNDPGRLAEMIKIGIENDDLFYCHLGDIADTKAEYYYNTRKVLDDARVDWWEHKLVEYSSEYILPEDGLYIDPQTQQIGRLLDFELPFYPVVGNHDITHNGWSLYSDLFKTSFYEFTVATIVDGDTIHDRFIFLDSASGTLGNCQIDEIESGVFSSDGKIIRHTFVFTHTNIFRPSLNEFASTYCREEMYYILDKLADWNTSIMFYGHVHAWDRRTFGFVDHITMPSMNFVDHPNGGDDLMVRVTVKEDGTYKVEPVGLHCKERSKEELIAEGFMVL